MDLPEEKLKRACGSFFIAALWLAPFYFLGEQWAIGAIAFVGGIVVFYLLNYFLVEATEIDLDEWLQERVSNLRLLWLYTLNICGFFGVIYASGQPWALGVIVALLLLVLFKVTGPVLSNTESAKANWRTLELGEEERPRLKVQDVIRIVGIPFSILLPFQITFIFSDTGYTREAALVNVVLWVAAFVSVFFVLFGKHPRVFSRDKWKILVILAWCIFVGCLLAFLVDFSIRLNSPPSSQESPEDIKESLDSELKEILD